MFELEKTYLAKYIPEDIYGLPHKEVTDVYFPESAKHPVLRLRKNGDKFEMTKKTPVDANDRSHQKEETIPLSEAEYEALSQAKGKVVSKMRYFRDVAGIREEFDVFLGDLQGLVMVDFEFKNKNDMDHFSPPDYCLADVTQEDFVAGGMLCGKAYSDIKEELSKFDYLKLTK